MMLTIIVAGTSVWPCSYAVASEASALQLRAKTQGIGWAVSGFATAITGIALPYIFNPDEGNLRGKTGYTYVGSCLVGAVVSWYLVPEMKGRTVEEIDGCFEKGLKAWEFEGFKIERDGEGSMREGREERDEEEGRAAPSCEQPRILVG